MSDRRNELLTDAGLLLVTVIWGVNFPVVKVALETLHPLAFNALRFPLAALVLFLLLRARGPLRVPRREDVPRIVGLGLLGNVLYQLLFIYGLDGTLSGNAAILLATVPVWTVVLSALRGHERPDATVWTGVLLTLVGMLALVLGGRATVAVGGATLRGDLLSVTAAVAWAVYTVEGREVVARYGSLQVTAWTLWIGALFLVLLGLPALLGTSLGDVPPIAWGGVLYAGTLAVGIAYLLWYWAVRRIGSSRTAVFGNFVPVIALLVAWIWLGERPTGLQLVGAGVVLGGMTLTRLRRSSARPPGADGGATSSPADPSGRRRHRRGAEPGEDGRRSVFGMDRRVLVLGAARMADAFGNSFLIVVLPLYVASGLVGEETAGISEPLVSGIVLGLFGLVSSVAQPVAGRLSDRAGKRKAFVILGLLLLGAANLAFAWADSYVGLILVRSLQGLGAAFTITAGVALVSELSELGTRGENMGLYNSLRLIGFGIGPLVAGVVVEGGPYAVPGTAVELTGFHVAFGMAAFSALVSAVLVARYVQDPDETRPTTERVAIRLLAREGPGVLDPIFTLGIATFLMAACIALLAPIEPEINRRLDQGAILFSVEFSALIAALAVVQPVVGRLSDVRGRKGFIVAGLSGLAPTTLIQGLVTTPWGMVAARLAQGVSAALVLAPALALAGDLARRGQTGSQLSVLTVAFGLGISAGQLASGYLVRYGVPAPFAAGAAISLLGVAAVATQVRESVEVPGGPSRDPAGPGG